MVCCWLLLVAPAVVLILLFPWALECLVQDTFQLDFHDKQPIHIRMPQRKLHLGCFGIQFPFVGTICYILGWLTLTVLFWVRTCTLWHFSCAKSVAGRLVLHGIPGQGREMSYGHDIVSWMRIIYLICRMWYAGDIFLWGWIETGGTASGNFYFPGVYVFELHSSFTVR